MEKNLSFLPRIFLKNEMGSSLRKKVFNARCMDNKNGHHWDHLQPRSNLVVFQESEIPAKEYIYSSTPSLASLWWSKLELL